MSFPLNAILIGLFKKRKKATVIKENGYSLRQASPDSAKDEKLYRSMLVALKAERVEDKVRVKEGVKDFLYGKTPVWFVEKGGVPVGFGALFTKDRWIGPAWIHPEHRHRGLHHRLLEVRVREGGEVTAVYPSNLASKRSLESFGFVEAESWSFNEEAVVMRLPRMRP